MAVRKRNAAAAAAAAAALAALAAPPSLYRVHLSVAFALVGRIQQRTLEPVEVVLDPREEAGAQQQAGREAARHREGEVARDALLQRVVFRGVRVEAGGTWLGLG